MAGPYLVTDPDDLHLTDEELEAKYPGLADEPAGLFRSTLTVEIEPVRRVSEWQAGMFSVDEMLGAEVCECGQGGATVPLDCPCCGGRTS